MKNITPKKLAQIRATEYQKGFEVGLRQGQQENGDKVSKDGLRIPKEILVLYNKEKKQIVAINGRWQRLPEDCEVLTAYYKSSHQQFKDL